MPVAEAAAGQEHRFPAGPLQRGEETDPAEITHGTEVFVRAQGKVVRVERKGENGRLHVGVAAVIERYDIIRGEAVSV